MARTLQGIDHIWQIDDTPIGSGDAGEVYTVTRLDQPELRAVMKKPAKIATGGTIQRQAGQIALEAHALTLLDGLPNGKAHPPRVLDQAPEFTKGTANYFMVSETAPGENLNTLLTQARQSGQPFPQRVIITVLDALFDMFSRAHKAGVLWNDVKLEHIYWDNLTGNVAVIDWGNALFPDDHGKHTRPRWEDYQQMVDSLGSFLKSSAPELYVDLGWDEFQGKTLNSLLVSTLARRISYQQQVIALQVMEFQSLIRVILNSDPSLEGLRKIADFQQTLNKIGAPWDPDDVLRYSQKLIESTLATKDHQTTVTSTALIWEIFDESLDLPWHLLREYCRHADILTHQTFPDLVKHTLNTSWEDALWAVSTIASQNPVPAWWERLVPVMRQTALDSNIPSPYQACQSLYTWAKGHHQIDLVSKLDRMLTEWHTIGQEHHRSPLDYALLDLLHDDVELPNRQQLELRQSFAQVEEAIRALIKAWREANWDVLSKAFRHIISWDPDRWGVLQLSQQVEDLQTWLETLFNGPSVGTSIRAFLEGLFASRPELERSLGLSPWLSALTHTLNNLIQGGLISAHFDVVRLYCPWLLQYTDLQDTDFNPPQIDAAEQHALLVAFIADLKNWQNLTVSLNKIRQQIPLLYPICHRLVEHFSQVFSLTADLEKLAKIPTQSAPTDLKEAYQALQALIDWRKYLAENDVPGAIHRLAHFEQEGWALAAHAGQVTTRWQQSILPALQAIHSFSTIPGSEGPSQPSKIQPLIEIAQTCLEIKLLWGQVYDAGIFGNLLDALKDKIDFARSAFMAWRGALESSTDNVERLVYLHQLDNVRQISNCLLKMTQHIRQAKLSFSLLGNEDQTSPSMQKKNIGDVLYHLTAIEVELVPDPDRRRFPGYQTAFEHITEASSHTNHQALIAGLEQDHPFYAWLVKSTLA